MPSSYPPRFQSLEQQKAQAVEQAIKTNQRTRPHNPTFIVKHMYTVIQRKKKKEKSTEHPGAKRRNIGDVKIKKRKARDNAKG